MSLIVKKKKRKKLMVLGSQHVVVTVSWLSEKKIYIQRERGKEKRRQGGTFLERDDEGGEC